MNASVIILSLCQALLVSGNVLLVSVNALVGTQLSPSPELITLPVALQFVGLMCATIPASLIMAKIGRKKGFYLGNLVGILGAAFCLHALAIEQFWFFCLGTSLLGVGIGFGNLYRFAAIEVCHPDYKNRAISMTLAGGIIAAVIGPNLAIYSRSWLDGSPFIGAFVGLLCLYIISLLLITGIKISDAETHDDQQGERSLITILMQPEFFIAVIAAMVAYAVMALVMTATPLAMDHQGFHFDDSAIVIQWHVIGMFAPSFFTGRLIERFGIYRILVTGALLNLACLLINISGQSYSHFMLALILLGVGWNFMFISATQLVTESYRTAEKAKSQAMNEFFVFSAVTLSALASGWMETTLGWQLLNLSMLPLIVGTILVMLYFARVINQPSPATDVVS
ncbi:MAG: MFS transporter [Motiliproteus sp.]|nr:MFS transporter [Motiliproteus sp.]MCW9052064.1 MFS transporter [Motiliproteus sp.]